MTEALYTSSAPVFEIEGERRGELARDLLRLDVEDSTHGLKRLRATFHGIGPSTNGGGAEQLQYLDGAILDFGKKLTVSIGPPSEERTIFAGVISALEIAFEEGDQPVVTVFAEDELMKLRMSRRMRTYEQVSDADIARRLASEHGLSADTAADGPTYDVVQQWNQSDLAFLRSRAELVQAELWASDGTLYFKTRGNRTGTSVTLVQGNHLIAAEIRADLAHQRTKVKVSGFDASQRDRVDEEASGDAIQAEVSGGVTGPATLERALGERVTYRLRETPLVATEATAWAKAELLRRARAFVTVVGTTRGTPDLAVGSQVTLERVGAPFDGGGYYATHVRHSYDLQLGHRTRFEAERATINEAGR